MDQASLRAQPLRAMRITRRSDPPSEVWRQAFADEGSNAPGRRFHVLISDSHASRHVGNSSSSVVWNFEQSRSTNFGRRATVGYASLLTGLIRLGSNPACAAISTAQSNFECSPYTRDTSSDREAPKDAESRPQPKTQGLRPMSVTTDSPSWVFQLIGMRVGKLFPAGRVSPTYAGHKTLGCTQR